MADIRKYISVLKSPSADSAVTFLLKTMSPLDNVYVEKKVTVTLLPDNDELENARAIYDRFVTVLRDADLLYADSPTFSGVPSSKWKLYQCDHIINIWSEVNFSLKIVREESENNAGQTILIGTEPVLSTIQEALESAPIVGGVFVDEDGEEYDDLTMARALKLTSHMVHAVTGNIVASIYLHTEIGNLQTGFHVSNTPVIYRPPVRSRFPLSFTSKFDEELIVGLEFNDDAETGFVSLGFNLAFGIALKFAYIAGQPSVPDAVKAETVRVSKYLKLRRDVKQIKGADFSITMSAEDVQASIKEHLGMVM